MPLAQKVTGIGISGATAAGSAMAIVPAPYDRVLSIRSLGGVATITFPATVGKSWQIGFVSGTSVTVAGAAFSGGIITVGGLVLAEVGIGAIAGNSFVYVNPNVGMLFPANTAVIIAFSFGAATYNQVISAGAYLV